MIPKEGDVEDQIKYVTHNILIKSSKYVLSNSTNKIQALFILIESVFCYFTTWLLPNSNLFHKHFQ